LDRDVECGDRLIEHDELGFEDEGPRDRPLACSTARFPPTMMLSHGCDSPRRHHSELAILEHFCCQ
jgi:hypothetical protein